MATIADYRNALAEMIAEAQRLNKAAERTVFNPAALELARASMKPNDHPDADAFLQAARNEWASDDIEIDDDAVVSPSDSGAFVSAWVWVSNEEAGVEEAENEDGPTAPPLVYAVTNPDDSEANWNKVA